MILMTAQTSEIIDSGTDIQLKGKSGDIYTGKIYSSKSGNNSLEGAAIVCLTNSYLSNDGWKHQMNSIYKVDDAQEAMEHFIERDDISHIVFIPLTDDHYSGIDKVDDLIRSYIHK
ncbi:MAG TPA: hypothetical protein VM368_02230 [Flavisolibacter sp.]|nr:hypothetical protein [Flavisolibacter sp.]